MVKQAKVGKRKSRWWVWFFELLIIIAIVFFIRGWQQRHLASGEAPEFDEITVQGEQVSLEDYHGKPMLLHFWASVCSTCEFQQKSISKMAGNWPVVTVAYNSGEVEVVKRYMEREGIQDWVTIIDNEGELAEQYGVNGVPTSFVLDRAGNIRFSEVGLSSGWGLRFRLWFTETLF